MVDDLEQPRIVETRVGDDQLVERELVERFLDVGSLLHLADEVVDDAAPARAERCAEMRACLVIADEHHFAAHAGGAQQRRGHHLVAAAEDGDQDRDEDRTDDVQAERREVLSGADREREREPRDERDARHDPSCSFPRLARGVEPGAPEDEREQQDQKDDPVALVIPEQAPENRFRVEEDRAKRQRRIEAERQAGDVDREQRERAREAPGERLERRP